MLKPIYSKDRVRYILCTQHFERILCTSEFPNDMNKENIFRIEYSNFLMKT
jgi:hypothetical protein